MTDVTLYTLQEALSDLEIAIQFPGPADQVVVSGYDFYVYNETTYWTFVVSLKAELLLTLPGINQFGIVLKDLARVDFVIGTTAFMQIQTGHFDVRLPPSLFKAVEKAPNGEPVRDEQGWKLEMNNGEPRPRDISVNLLATLTFDSVGGMAIDLPFVGGSSPALSLDPVMIGNTDVVIKVSNLVFVFTGNSQGISFDIAAIYLPPALPAAPDLKITNCFISEKGFSGYIFAEWDLQFDVEHGSFIGDLTGSLFGFKGGLRRVALEFKENIPIASDIQGQMLVPYFDGAVEVTAEIQSNADPKVQFLSLDPNGVTLTKDELLALNIQSLTVGKVGDTAYVFISGRLKPLLMTSDGLEWPQLDVKDLSIEQDITDLTKPPVLKFKEAWLDLKELTTLDLWGFHFELNRVGLGFEETRDRLWVDLTGSLRLIEQIPVGLGVEGFRLSWPRDLSAIFGSYQGLELATHIASQLEVEFAGVHLFYGVPGAIEFEGSLGFIKSAQVVGFRGDMALRVPATGLAIEAGLMVGINFETPPYPFLFLTFAVQFPAGIPLAQSGLALKGVQGLFGLNVSPNRTEDQEYYDWYKRDKLGADKTSKWKDERNALALGMGLTITTVDGYIKGVRGLLVLAIPGPTLIIEGRALIFDGLTPAEPPLRALAVIDGKGGTIQFNIEAEAVLIEDMLDAYGPLEAFFDFNDLTNWHMYLGQDDCRIQANVLKFKDAFLFKADAYLMVDMIGSQTLRSRMGVFIGFKPPAVEFEFVKITLDAVLEGRGNVTVLPEQFSGEVNLSANIELKVFDFGLQLAAAGSVKSEGPKPLKVDAEVIVSVELPGPLEDFSETLQFSWEAPEPPEITPPLVAVTADSPFVPGGGALPIFERIAVESQSDWRREAENSPVAPIDTRPVLSFNHEMNDEARVPDSRPQPAFARHPNGTAKTYNVGLMQFTPTLTAVRLYEHRKGEPWPNSLDGWKPIASSLRILTTSAPYSH